MREVGKKEVDSREVMSAKIGGRDGRGNEKSEWVLLQTLFQRWLVGVHRSCV